MLIWVEISRSALENNIRVFRELVGKSELMAVVKANAYGHGMMEVARVAQDCGVNWFGVNSIDEAVQLKDAGFDTPILVLGYVDRDGWGAAVSKDIRMVVYDVDTIKGIARVAERIGKIAHLHLKVETGTHRQGVTEDTLWDVLDVIRELSWVELEGIYSHFADIEDTTNHAYAKWQMSNFLRFLDKVKDAGFHNVKRHFSCTAAALLFPETHFDIVRLGIGLYGLWPSRETYVSLIERKETPPVLMPVMTWKTKIVQVKKLPKGAYIGYGRTYKTTHSSIIAILPVGYYDGYFRAFSNRAYVLIKGERAPVRGRVCMNITMVDVTHIPDVKVGDEVILLGGTGEDRISAEFLADIAGTINYEVVTRVNSLHPRIVVQ